jgi:polyhydroxybutyrate depolymerase
LPLVISLHGPWGTDKSQETISDWDCLADRYGFLVAYPDGYRRT